MDPITGTQAEPARARRYRPCKSEVAIEPFLIAFLTMNAFYAEVNRHVKKVYTRDIPHAAGVVFDREQDMFIMYLNPDYLKIMSDKQIQALLMHEFSHVVFGHCAMALRPHKLWNIAQDLHINGLIKRSADDKYLSLYPTWPVPGVRAAHRDGTPLTEEELKLYPLVTFIEGLPDNASSVQYYHALVKAGFDKIIKDDAPGFYGIESTDHHDDDGLGGAPDDYIVSRSRNIAEKAVKMADARGNWGNMPQDVRAALRAWVNRSVDWRAVLHQWVGFLNHGSKRSTIKKINRRYPYVHPGVQRAQIARLLLALDQSASVSNQMIELLFAEIASLAENVEIDLIHFDSTVDVASLQTVKKGTRPPANRTRQGGTSFQAITDFVNDDDNHGRWDGVMIMTDGEAYKPGECNVRRAWCIPDSCKLEFDTDETIIVVSGDQDATFG